jgi:nitroreductase
LKCQLGYRQIERQLTQNKSAISASIISTASSSVLEKILDLARWAPSGDNTQPWRFEIINNNHLILRGFDTRNTVVYDLQGHASQLALGGLLETIEIAAQRYGLRSEVSRRKEFPDTTPTFDVKFSDIPAEPHLLESVIRARTTQRRAMSRQPLRHQERDALNTAVGANYRVIWLEGRKNLWQMARLLFNNAGIRLTMPEAYEVHRRVIDWNQQFSVDRIPDLAVGLEPLTLNLMRWAMQSWQRVSFLNTWLGGTLLPRLQLDVWPALNCAAHFIIVAEQPLQTIDDYVAGGRAMQRFWLTATKLGLQFQPEMTPLIFASYVQQGITFTKTPYLIENAYQITKQLENLFATVTLDNAVYLGRVGFGPAPTARSLRLPLIKLMAK